MISGRAFLFWPEFIWDGNHALRNTYPVRLESAIKFSRYSVDGVGIFERIDGAKSICLDGDARHSAPTAAGTSDLPRLCYLWHSLCQNLLSSARVRQRHGVRD